MTTDQAFYRFYILNEACNEQVEFNNIAGAHPEKDASIDMEACFQEMDRLCDQFEFSSELLSTLKPN